MGEEAAQVRFGEHTVDLAARTVSRGDEPISLEPQVFDVLAVLIEHRDRVVSKLELFDRVWGDRFVSPATLTSRIRDLRAALGDSGRSQHVIKTAHGRGFRFVASLDVESPVRPVEVAGRVPEGLLGRTSELADLVDRMTGSRLVTLVGPGGVGKTTLMREVVDGVDASVCELTAVRDGDGVVLAMLAALRASEQPEMEPLDALVAALEGRDVWLAVDNCEHVIDDVVAVVGELMTRTPDVRVLATSRRPLRLADENVMRIGPLDADAAARLFRARAARHGVALDEEHDADIDRICGLLDRLPLAIELAASKVRALPLRELTRLLDQRFAVLTTDAHDVTDHHRSLDATIAWSVDLLTDAQRDLLTQLAVFVGPFDLAAVEAVCEHAEPDGSVVAELVALVDLSLIVFEPSTSDYRLLESVRMFAERVGIPASTLDRFRDHVVTTVESAGALPAARLTTDLLTIRSAWPAVRAVVSRARETGDDATVHRVVAAVARFAEQTFAFEVIDWTESGDALPQPVRAARALLLTHRGDFEDAARELECLDADRESSAAGPVDGGLELLARLWHTYFTGDLQGADRQVAEIRRLEGSTGSYVEIVAAVGSQFLDKGAQRGFDAATVARLDEVSGSGDPVSAIGAEVCEMLRLDWESEADRAVERLTASIDEAGRLGLAFLASGASTARSIALAVSPSAETSVRVLRATLRSYADAGSWQFALADFAATAAALVEQGEARAAAELLGAREAAGFVGDSSAAVARRAADAATAELGQRAFDDAVRQGRARDPATATRLALAVLDRLVG